MEQRQGLELAQGGLCGCALRVEHLEQGEASLAVSALDSLRRPLRVRQSRSPQYVDLARRSRERVVGLGQRENERRLARGPFGFDLCPVFQRRGDVAEILIPYRDRNGSLQLQRIVALGALVGRLADVLPSQ